MAVEEWTNVHFEPYEPSDFRTKTTRLLIVGESHYGGYTGSDVTKDVIREHLDGCCRLAFFTKVATAVHGAIAAEIEEQRRFYGDVAFYNYVQHSIEAARIAPTKDQFDCSVLAFREVLRKLKPTRIIALGWRLYDNTPSFWDNGDRAWEKGSDCGPQIHPKGAQGYFVDGTLRYPCLFISHPSGRGFSPQAWHTRITAFLDC
jgi:hypothetical protein